MALCAQPFGWLTLVEVIETLLLCGAEVQKPGEAFSRTWARFYPMGARPSTEFTHTGSVPERERTAGKSGLTGGFQSTRRAGRLSRFVPD
jgi:hypothetical protein